MYVDGGCRTFENVVGDCRRTFENVVDFFRLVSDGESVEKVQQPRAQTVTVTAVGGRTVTRRSDHGHRQVSVEPVRLVLVHQAVDGGGQVARQAVLEAAGPAPVQKRQHVDGAVDSDGGQNGQREERAHRAGVAGLSRNAAGPEVFIPARSVLFFSSGRSPH